VISELLATKAFATLTFLGISATPMESSLQKSLMMQSLRAAFPEPSAFIEESPETDFAVEASTEHLRLTLRCIACFRVTEPLSIDPESVSYTSNDRRPSMATAGSALTNAPSEYEFSFRLQSKSQVSDSNQNTETQAQHKRHESEVWRVALSIRKLNFGVFTSRKIERGSNTAAQDFRILPCLATNACVSAKTFPTYEAANTAIHRDISARNARSAIASGRQVDTDDFVAPTLVDRGANVMVILENPSGLTIKTKGTALRSGATGEIIPVQIIPGSPKESGTASTQTIQARIMAKGEVRYER
jgi:flagella basal body P-ring formation protein FlgA